jgi:prevent-host-death family protein
MKAITVTAARKRFGALLDAVRHGPVLVRRKNRDASVIMSAEEYERVRGSRGANPRRATIDPKADGSWKPAKGTAM